MNILINVQNTFQIIFNANDLVKNINFVLIVLFDIEVYKMLSYFQIINTT